MTNRHDKRRKDQIIKTLHKARDQIETATLYLGVQEPRPMQEIYAMDDALEHVNQALERLGVTLLGGRCYQMKIKGGVWRWMPEGARLMLILLAAERTSRRWKKKAALAEATQ